MPGRISGLRVLARAGLPQQDVVDVPQRYLVGRTVGVLLRSGLAGACHDAGGRAHERIGCAR
eukprot:4699770-Pyramimonas_sp.AAC.1